MIDVKARSVAYTHTLTGLTELIVYDQLVVALGSSTSTFGLPGVADRVFALKTLEDAGILRNRLVWLLELADSTTDAALRRRYLTIAVVGGGFTGVEAAGELVELFRSVLRFYPTIDPAMLHIVLIEGGATLLPGLPARMGSYSANFLSKRGVEILTGDGVATADDNGIVLQSGRCIETATIVWSAGVAPSATVRYSRCRLPSVAPSSSGAIFASRACPACGRWAIARRFRMAKVVTTH